MAKHKESGDALEDDFQPSDTEFVSDGEEAGVQVDNSDYDNDSDNVQDKHSASASIGSKRKAAETPKKKQQNKVRTTQEKGIVASSVPLDRVASNPLVVLSCRLQIDGVPSKKPKKQRTEESATPIGKRSKAAQIAALNDSQDRALEHLSSIEREERRIPESAIKNVSPFALDHTLVHLESFLKFAVANWKSKLMVKDANAKEDQGMKGKGTAQPRNPRDTKKKPLETSTDLPKGSPVVLIVSSSGIRSVDVIRALPLFAEAAKVGKLFAKHLKVPEQVHFLNNTVTHICTGTPNRIEKLIADGMGIACTNVTFHLMLGTECH